MITAQRTGCFPNNESGMLYMSLDLRIRFGISQGKDRESGCRIAFGVHQCSHFWE